MVRSMQQQKWAFPVVLVALGVLGLAVPGQADDQRSRDEPAVAASEPAPTGRGATAGITATWQPLPLVGAILAINDDGDLLYRESLSGPARKVLRADGTMVDLDTDPAWLESSTERIVEGFVVGSSAAADSRRITLWDENGDVATVIEPTGGNASTNLVDVNNNGLIVGVELDSQVVARPVRWTSAGVGTDIPSDQVMAVNDADQIAVNSAEPPQEVGILTNGSIEPIATLDITDRVITGPNAADRPVLNDSGDLLFVVSHQPDEAGYNLSSMLWRDGVLTRLAPGQLPTAMNDSGYLAGFAGTTAENTEFNVWAPGSLSPVPLTTLLGWAPRTATVVDFWINNRCQMPVAQVREGSPPLWGIVTLAPCDANREIVVNSMRDRPDKDTSDDVCDTGSGVGGRRECTMRAAIQTANERSGGTTSITFAIRGSGTPRIALAKALPKVEVPVDIDATSQRGGWVELSGGGRQLIGLQLLGGNSTVRGLVINGFGTAGLLLADEGNNTVAGNRIGTNVAGRSAVANGVGILVRNSPGNQIGGIVPTDQNVISGNRAKRNKAASGGVLITGSKAKNNRIEGNLIGLGTDGKLLLNSTSVQLGSNGNVVGTDGGGPAAAANLIAGNSSVVITGSGNRVAGNRIGLDRRGGKASGESTFGVWVIGGDTNVIESNVIAGHLFDVDILSLDGSRKDPAKGNRVVDNVVGLTPSGTGLPEGLGCSRGNFGVRADGAPATEISGNRIAGHAWDLVITGVPQLGVQEIDVDQCRLVFGTPDAPFAGNRVLGTDIMVENNTVGLLAGGKVPRNLDSQAGIAVFGKAENVTIEGNTVAGHRNDIRLDDGKNHVVAMNTVVGPGRTPVGEVGLLVGRATDVTIEANTFAGHGVAEVALNGGKGHTITGNRIGTLGRGAPSYAGIVIGDTSDLRIGGRRKTDGNVISGNATHGIFAAGRASGTVIRNNLIGTNAAGNRSVGNRVGIEVGRKASATVITANVVSGNDIAIALSSAAKLESNRIGLGRGTTALGNGDGVIVEGNDRVFMKDNSVIGGRRRGIEIRGGGPKVTIQGGSIAVNGDRRGIAYTSAAPEKPATVLAMKSRRSDQAAGIYLGARVPGRGTRTIEFWGNPNCDDPEGLTSLGRYQAQGGESIVVFIPNARIAELGGFAGVTATLTGGDFRTSEFSRCAPVREWRDSDRDGAFDLSETLAPNNGDANNDGTPDVDQRRVATLYTDAGFITVDAGRGNELTGTSAAPNAALPGAPYGVLGFVLSGVGSGDRATITILTARPPAAGQGFAVVVPVEGGGVEAAILGEPGPGTDGATQTPTGWTLRITDGGPNDLDVDSSTITLQGGPLPR